MKRKIFAILLNVLLTIWLMGCGQSKEPVLAESILLEEYYSVENTIPVGEYDSVIFDISPSDIDESAIELVNSDENAAICLIKDIRLVTGKKIAIVSYRGNEIGETTFYLRDVNGEVQSETIHISVEEKKESMDHSPMVYLNDSGDKYHYNYSCAGKTAYKSTLNNAAKLGKGPCSKCAK